MELDRTENILFFMNDNMFGSIWWLNVTATLFEVNEKKIPKFNFPSHTHMGCATRVTFKLNSLIFNEWYFQEHEQLVMNLPFKLRRYFGPWREWSYCYFVRIFFDGRLNSVGHSVAFQKFSDSNDSHQFIHYLYKYYLILWTNNTLSD